MAPEPFVPEEEAPVTSSTDHMEQVSVPVNAIDRVPVLAPEVTSPRKMAALP